MRAAEDLPIVMGPDLVSSCGYQFLTRTQMGAFSCHYRIVFSQPPGAIYTLSGCKKQRHVRVPWMMEVYVVNITRFVDVAPRL